MKCPQKISSRRKKKLNLISRHIYVSCLGVYCCLSTSIQNGYNNKSTKGSFLKKQESRVTKQKLCFIIPLVMIFFMMYIFFLLLLRLNNILRQLAFLSSFCCCCCLDGQNISPTIERLEFFFYKLLNFTVKYSFGTHKSRREGGALVILGVVYEETALTITVIIIMAEMIILT